MYRRITCLLSLLLFCAVAAAENGRYTIDSTASDIHWRIYSAGVLSGLGHNHVISTGRVDGGVQLADAPQASVFELQIPVSALVVDNPVLRRRYGEGFSKQMSPQAIADTRANMLGESLLKVRRYSHIRLSGTALATAGKDTQDLLLDATIELAGRRIKLRLPARVKIDARKLRASGSFTLSHQQLGLKPFRVALGALQVAQKIDFTYDIRARRAD